MKNIFKPILRFIAKIVAFFLHPYIIKVFNTIITYVTTEYIVKQLKSCGKNPISLFPITTHGLQHITVGENFNACSRLRLEAYDRHMENIYTPEIVIGDNVSIGYDCHIGCVNKIHIGNNVLIASKVYITDHFHGDTTAHFLKIPPNLRKVISKGAVIIEDNVWIGEGVAIMPNVKIGAHSIIGANAVVTKNIPPNSVVGGVPAKIIKSNNKFYKRESK